MIRPTEVKEIKAEGEDYPGQRENLPASMPEGFELLHVRRVTD
ncbi:hypothetical protein [Kocuria rosea]|nr:hypothetical protein [Kocuria rosea]WIG19219.1 hypothetical protein QOY29_17205 [Kocuria rosea]